MGWGGGGGGKLSLTRSFHFVGKFFFFSQDSNHLRGICVFCSPLIIELRLAGHSLTRAAFSWQSRGDVALGKYRVPFKDKPGIVCSFFRDADLSFIK